MNINQYKPEGFTGISEGQFNIYSLERAMSTGKILQAPAVLCDGEMSLIVELGGQLRGIIEKDEVTFSPLGEDVKDIAVLTRVGKPVCFKVLSFERVKGERVVRLSRKEAQRDCWENRISKYMPGDIIDAKITHIENFGAFADIGCGIVSLLPIDCISVSRISSPRDRFSPGDKIRAVIKSTDIQNGRLYLTHKELLGTWEENTANFEIGHTVPGIIRSVEPYGIFIELAPNLAGLAEYRDDVCVGQGATVYIKNIIPKKMKIKLVIVDITGEQQTPAVGSTDYFVTGEHIDRWVYTPDECGKTIETVFE